MARPLQAEPGVVDILAEVAAEAEVVHRMLLLLAVAEVDILVEAVVEHRMLLLAAEVVPHTRPPVVGVHPTLQVVVVAAVLPRIPHFIPHPPAQPFIKRPPRHTRRQSIALQPSAIRARPPGLPGRARRTPRILEPASIPQQRFIRRQVWRAMRQEAREPVLQSIPVARELAPRAPAAWGDLGPGPPLLRA